MKKISGAIAVFLFLLFSGCYVGVPLTMEKPKNNSTYNVQYLFEYEGCKVYRFYDHGREVYFTNCKGNVTSFANDSTETRLENHIKIDNEQ